MIELEIKPSGIDEQALPLILKGTKEKPEVTLEGVGEDHFQFKTHTKHANNSSKYLMSLLIEYFVKGGEGLKRDAVTLEDLSGSGYGVYKVTAGK